MTEILQKNNNITLFSNVLFIKVVWSTLICSRNKTKHWRISSLSRLDAMLSVKPSGSYRHHTGILFLFEMK